MPSTLSIAAAVLASAIVVPLALGIAYGQQHVYTGWDPLDVVETDTTYTCDTCDRQIDDVATDECPGCGSRLQFNSSKQ